jgi:O-antigen/teichoic acid export membrane protein
MGVWLSIAAIVLALAFVGVTVFYHQYRRGQIERVDMVGAAALIAVAILLVVLSELLANEIVGYVFFFWLPIWFIWYTLRRRRHV